MLAQIRTVFAHSWIARISAAVLAVAFGGWGIQGALTGGGPGAQDVATVRGGGAVSVPDFDTQFQRALAQEAQSLAQNGGMAQGGSGSADPSALPPPIRHQVGQEVLRRLVTEQVLVAHARTIGLSVPDDIVRSSIFAIPAFKGPDGQFDHARFAQVLQDDHLTEPQVVLMVRTEILNAGLIEPVRAPVVMPPVLVRTLFDWGAETRTVDLVDVAVAAMPAPPAPDEATLRRFFTNHPALFTVPESRKIRTVVLSPDTVGQGITVSEADIRAAYDAQEGRLFKPARRTVEVVTLPDARRAGAIVAFWQGGGGWPQVEAMAEKAGGTAVALTDAAEREFPSKALGQAVFATAPGTVAGPVREELGGFGAFRVIDAKPASGDFASVRDQLRSEIAAQRASSLLPDRVDQLQDAIAGGGLDKIPMGLGASAAEGTLDAKGMTPEGEPAPLPASGALRDALVARAFSQAKGAPAQLVQAPQNAGWYAVEVEAVTPSRRKSVEEARANVLRAWTADAQRHAADERATAIYTQAKQTRTLDAAGLPVLHPAPFRRGGGAPGVPASLPPVAFSLKPGDATMVASDDGYAVAVLTAITHPDPSTQQAAYDRLTAEANQALGNDLEIAYAAHLTEISKPQINTDAFNCVVGQ